MSGQRPGRLEQHEDTPTPAGARDRAHLTAGVSPVRPGGRRAATLATALIIVAFLAGLARPWDWLGGGDASATPPAASTAGGAPPGTPGQAEGSAGSSTPVAEPGSAAVAVPTCGYPQDWRAATIQDWVGRMARVWTAVEAVQSSGPRDPAIPFQVVVGDHFAAIGWCAPVQGPDRPPLSAVGHLFRVDGTRVTEIAARRLEPAGPSALGELWAPPGAVADRDSPSGIPSPGGTASASPSTTQQPAGAEGAAEWSSGRYVILLATPDGAWSRWIGVELVHVPAALASPSEPEPSAGAVGP